MSSKAKQEQVKVLIS